MGEGARAAAAAFAHPGRVDAARVGGETARPQPGGVYAGWITDAVKGPVKGAPGTEDW